MSGIDVIARQGEIALAAATAKTVLQVRAAANHRVLVRSWGVFFDGVSATAEPVEVSLVRQTTTGTMTTFTPVKTNNSLPETLQTTTAHTATVEPTSGDILRTIKVHPQGGHQELFPPDKPIQVPGGERLGIVCTAPAVVNVAPLFEIEE